MNGDHRDPMTVSLPKADPIAARDKVNFDAISHQLATQLTLLANSNIAALD
jgi:hypothetical protein